MGECMTERMVNDNLNYLDKKFPGLKKLVEEKRENLLSKENIEVNWKTSYTNDIIMQIVTSGQILYLAGKRNPMGPVENQMSIWGRIVPNAPVFLIGIGNIGYWKQICEKTDKSVITVVYEPNFTIFYEWLKEIDFSQFFDNRISVLLIGGINDEDESLNKIIGTVLTDDRIPLMKLMISPNYENFSGEKVISFVKKIKKKSNLYNTNLATRMFFNHVVAENFYNNVKYIKTGYKAGQLDGILPTDVPAIVVSAGPSLEKNINELKKAVGKSFIIAVDTAVKPLLKAGIRPDMFAMLDGVKPIKLVENEEARDIPLITYVTGAKAIVDYHKGQKFFVDEGYEYIYEMFRMNRKSIQMLPAGGSVATLAFSLVCHLGFETIVLVGQDLAYTGNKTHIAGAFENNEKDNIDDCIMVPGNVEKEVPSPYDFNMYRIWFEDFIKYWKNIKEVKFINATEGGARIEGTEIMPLQKVIEDYCTKKVNISECFMNIQSVFTMDEQEKIQQFFESTPERIQQIIDLARKGEQIYQKLLNMLSDNKFEKNYYKKQLKKIRKIDKEIEENPNFQIISETMVIANQIIDTSQHFKYDTINEDGIETAKQGKLYMELLGKYATVIKEIAENTVGKRIIS